MKRTFLLFGLTAALAVITLNSNSSGPAHNNNGNATGGPGSSGTCGSCHSGGSGTTASVSLKKKSDNSPATSQYAPGVTYVVTVNGTHASLTRFGYQLMAVKSGNAQAGTWGALGGDHHTKTVGSVNLIEHHHALTKTGSNLTTSFEWTAPTAGTGTVTFHGILNAVNNDGTTGGDAVSAPFNLTLAESPTGINDLHSLENLSVYPNPALNELHVSIPSNGAYTFRVFGMNGDMVLTQQTTARTSSTTLNVTDIAKGVYYLEITKGSSRKVLTFVKE